MDSSWTPRPSRIYRIWSIDWFYDPRRETKKLIEFLELRRVDARTEAVFEYEPEPPENDGEIAIEIASVEHGKAGEVAVSDAGDHFVEVGNRVDLLPRR